jgi:murein DD-endopeptidase MepM/ murein hydrolase activator NlpD
MTVRQHSGLDIEVSPGTAVVAAGAGRVTRAGAYGGYGNCVDITHGKNCVTRYAQLSKVLTSVGATVSVGQKIGLAGRTGRSTVPHLHVDVYVDGADAIASREGPSEGQWVSVGTALPLDVHDLDAATGRS